jgi:gamma-glutamyltranspeptidase
MNDRPAPTVGHAMSFDWTAAYPSRRQPIFARNAVATSQPLATQAGIAMLRAGGNAIDAALATAIALTVVEPCSNGLGSDLFAIVWDGRELAGLNASGRAPAAWTPERFARYREMPRTGWDTITIPGAVSGWAALSQRYGKLPFADLFASAIGARSSPTSGRRRYRYSETFPALPSISCRAAARPRRASSSPRPRWLRRWKRSPRPKAKHSIAAS